MKIELTLKNTQSQFLGLISNKALILDSNGKVILTDEEWNQIKNNKWNQYLIERGFLEVKEIDKKIKKIEKDIKEGKLEING